MKHISASDALGSVIGDDTWTLVPMKLENSGCPKFQLGDYDWVVELRPKDDFKGFLFGWLVDPSRHLRVYNEETESCRNKQWVRLYKPIEKLGYNVRVVLMKRDRLDTIRVGYIYTIGGNTFRTSFEARIHASIDDTKKLHKFLSVPGAKSRMMKTLQASIEGELAKIPGNINRNLELKLSQPAILGSGYKVDKVELQYIHNQQVA